MIMKKLADSISLDDLGIIFDNIHAMLALVNSAGALLSWNSAFDVRKRTFSEVNNLGDMLLQKDRDELPLRLQKQTAEHILMDFPVDGKGTTTLCECGFIPLSSERILFIVEGIESNTALRESVGQLSRRVKLFQIESEFSKKLAHNKQIEMESVLIQAEEVAQVDPLTFLPNRRKIIRILQDEVMRAERYKSSLTISVVDVDRFKLVNDTYGHGVGDEALRQVAQILRDGIRHPDIAGRYGGEEFLIILPSANLKAASEQANRLCKNMRETIVKIKDHEIKVTISIGIAQYRPENDSWDTILNRADNAMYKAKENGRDRWEVED